jgi:predicted transcriptional regulator
MSTSRSTNDIVAKILGLAKSGIRKSRVAEILSLDSRSLDAYSAFLKEQDLVREWISFDSLEGRSSTSMRTTKKGLDFLEKYNSLVATLGELFSPEHVERRDENLFFVEGDQVIL